MSVDVDVHADRARRRRAVAAVVVLVVLTALAAIVLRTVVIDRVGLNSDEAVYSGQAAGLAGDAALGRHFSPFRAHPLLLHSVLAAAFSVFGVGDAVGRLVVALLFGVPSVVAVGVLGRRLYGPAVGLLAAALLALLPYHVLLSRQVMLEVPAALFATLTVLAVHRYAETGRPAALLASAPLFAFTVLAKETMILLFPAMLVFLASTGRLRKIPWRTALLWCLVAGAVMLPFPLTRMLYGSGTSSDYILFQFARAPNHSWWYFPVVLWKMTSPAFLLAAAAGLVVLARRRSGADKLLLAWLVPFAVFHQAWPTKLFPYLVVITPALAIGAAVAIVASARAVAARRPATGLLTGAAFGAVVLFGLGVNSVQAVTVGTESLQGVFNVDAEIQDFAGAREAARWIGAHTPEGSVMLTIGPSVGNIISFYGDRDWYAMSVSQDPRLRNPAYRPIPNPDLALRSMQVQYAVWDWYSADRSAFYNARLMRYVHRYSGTPVFSAWLDGNRRVHTGRVAPPGADVRVVVYDVAGGDPMGEAQS